MRIAYVVPRCVTDNSHGRYVLGVARWLGCSHQVHIFSGAFPANGSIPATRQRIPLPDRPAIGRLAGWWAAAPLLVRASHFDIVHTIGGDAPVGSVITAPCCNRGIREAMKAAGLVKAGLARQRAGWLATAMQRGAELADRTSIRRRSVRRVLAPSRQVAAELHVHYGLPADRTTVVPWGVDLETFSPSRMQAHRHHARARFGYGQGDVVCLFVGGAYRLKGLPPLLEALRRKPDPRVRLLAVGVHRDPDLDAELRGELRDRVVVTGNVLGIDDLYAAADVFVLPTLYDGFSLATLEAMACGLPVIVSRCAGISDLLTNEADALLLQRPTDVDEILSAISRLKDDPAMRHRMGIRARRTAERCDWAEIARRVFQIYMEVAGSSADPHG